MCVCVVYQWTAGVSDDDALSMGKRRTSNVDAERWTSYVVAHAEMLSKANKTLTKLE